jgi:hypothetical protein
MVTGGFESQSAGRAVAAVPSCAVGSERGQERGGRLARPAGGEVENGLGGHVSCSLLEAGLVGRRRSLGSSGCWSLHTAGLNSSGSASGLCGPHCSSSQDWRGAWLQQEKRCGPIGGWRGEARMDGSEPMQNDQAYFFSDIF